MADTTSLVSIGAPARMAPHRRWLLAGLTWVLAALLMRVLDGHVDLSNQAMLLVLVLVLVLASALSALWLPVRATLALSTLALLAFNWAWVPPRGTFSVDLRQHAVLLGAMLCLNTLIALLMVRLRSRAELATAQAAQAEQRRLWSDTLRDAAEPLDHAPTLQQALSHWVGGAPVSLLLPTAGDAEHSVGAPDADQREALHLAQQQSRAMGPGTGWHDEQPGWTLPLRARHHSLGAAQQALDDAQAQVLRSTLLAAVAHDHCTPLATIMGAASSLLEQAARLSPEQRRRLAQTVLEPTAQLSRLTDNTLQLARQREPARRIHVRLAPDLPLLHFDAVLLAQLPATIASDHCQYWFPHETTRDLLHNLKHNQVLHAHNVILTVRFASAPSVPEAERITLVGLAEGFWQVTLHCGFMETPDVPQALTLCRAQGLDIVPMETSYFLSRETVVPSTGTGTGMALWREQLFATMSRHAGSAAAYFKLPDNAVVELGTRVLI